MDKFKHIRAYRVGWILPIIDFLILWPILLIIKRKTTTALDLRFLGDRKKIEQDIRHGAFFMTNHRDICMDAAWLTYLMRTHYFIHPYFGIGNNLFGKWWIEHVVRFLRAFVVIRNGAFHDQRKNAILLSQYVFFANAVNPFGWHNEKDVQKTETTLPNQVYLRCLL